MKKVLILGAGLVAKPLVRYLLDQPDFEIIVASRTVSKAVKLIDNHPRGTAKTLNLKDEEGLRDEIAKADIAISLVPYAFHPVVAKYCLEFKIPMVTTSYVSDAMNKLDGPARDAGILILNELGLDPGIDHMEAMRIIHEAESKGGTITDFTSYCGGLPAPEANTNPFGYKFSWSPIGVLLAGKNSAEYLMGGKHTVIPSESLFDDYKTIHIEGLGDFEGYPNRNSMPYIQLYGIESVQTMLRGTLRNMGWCASLKKIADLGLLDQKEGDWTGLTFKDLMGRLVNAPEGAAVKESVADFIGLAPDSEIMGRMDWLGLFSDNPLPVEKGSPLDNLGDLMLEKLEYAEGERDMIVLQHKFDIAYPGGSRERLTSTLIDFGIPFGDSSMSRTVGLPAAIGTRMILEGKINETGVHIPVKPEIYAPILAELKTMKIAFAEKRELLS
jgi:saccharopine dehydrogenase (NADP+, L-glutamate forming)